MASQRSKRKRRIRAQQPRSVTSTRREGRGPSAGPEQRTQRAAGERERRPANRTLGTVGERPQGLFGGVPVSEVAILAGGISFVIGMVRGGGPALYVGLIVLALGVVEFTAREHFSGYRSHTTLLAAIPALAVVTALEVTIGAPSSRILLAAVFVPVFGLLFYLLRRRFMVARQARIARPPAP